MSTMTRADIVELYLKYRERVTKTPEAAKFVEALDVIDRLIQESPGKPSVRLRDFGRLLKTYLPELTGKLGVAVAHQHFTTAAFLYIEGNDVQMAIKRARTVYEANKASFPAWLRARAA